VIVQGGDRKRISRTRRADGIMWKPISAARS